ncbi:hypothetical protein AVEN_215049-1 [Araneus ventricosus]|uniref:Uncharacterized protein n=1 Tax=Araneus ventricosus TaxID=182803 RepID=A0A4Y2TSZ0_ARAVE|nr:hypothetical protein AVEN_215049-1 [Araneus ventricosus]
MKRHTTKPQIPALITPNELGPPTESLAPEDPSRVFLQVGAECEVNKKDPDSFNHVWKQSPMPKCLPCIRLLCRAKKILTAKNEKLGSKVNNPASADKIAKISELPYPISECYFCEGPAYFLDTFDHWRGKGKYHGEKNDNLWLELRTMEQDVFEDKLEAIGRT